MPFLFSRSCPLGTIMGTLPLCILSMAVTNCTKSKKQAVDPVSTNNSIQQKNQGTEKKSENMVPEKISSAPLLSSKPAAPVNPTAAGTPAVILDDCDTSVKFKDQQPVFLPESKVMVTRVMSPCVSKAGVEGHKINAGWMAMGFPCTGGEGRIDWVGTNYNRPKMVSFLLETSCAMAPLDTSKIHAEAEKILGLSKQATMIAFNPFVTQYWEVPGYNDADTSFTVDLRSTKGIDDAWLRFIKTKPLKIILVGRENAWVPGNFMYTVEGQLHWASKNRFRFVVDAARALQGEELKKLQTRCEALRPERACNRVF